ncbi:MAG: (2Fe-2S) ferredoxin domain-containing protein [Epulopiscium sp.]|nr:(2Fe-2S) ferredoxin domain-containing protein [Candidatus Epulonipiscium sp.]
MKKIYVCIGSACHLKGSYKVIHKLQEIIQKEKLEDRIQINASFCLGECTKAVSVRLDEEGPIYSVQEDTVEQFFYDYIMGR